MKAALAGNPNSGKSTLFNTLTGMHRHVGNWPGKTVEKKEGRAGDSIIVDLPGTYSLSAYTDEELITRDYILQEKPDVVINVIDSCNLERSLYLTLQMIELGANLVVALNMNRLAEKKGIKVDHKALGKLLGVPVIRIEANSKSSSRILKFFEKPVKYAHKIRYERELEEHIRELKGSVKDVPYIPRWTAIKLIEKDPVVWKELKDKDLKKKAQEIRKHLVHVYDKDVDTILANARYGFITGLLAEAMVRTPRRSRSDIIDKAATSSFFGIPLFLFVMWAMFEFVFIFSEPLMGLVKEGFGSLTLQVAMFLPAGWISSFIVDAVFGGLGAVLVFTPPIFMLFFMLSILEDSGYMSRAAFVMDRFMHKLGLHGKSFIPLVLGFGCTVPAIMATRTLESEEDRIKTMLIAPFMSCGARLPVYLF